MPEPYVAALGRISGKLLAENLVRHGVDLSFKDTSLSTALLQLDVNNFRLGINEETPGFDLQVGIDTKTTDLSVTNNAVIDNFTLSSNQISTSVGPIVIAPSGPDPLAIFDKISSQYLFIKGNTIQSISNQNIRFDPNGTGTVELQSNTNVTGNLNVTGNINISGDLSKQGNIIIGDDVIDGEGLSPENDRVDFNVPFAQDLLPGQDNAYDLGGSLGDSTAGRWANAYIPDWTNIVNLLPRSALISDQMLLGDSITGNVIQATRSNDDILLNPDTGIIYIERTKWQDSDITNLNNTPLTLAATGNGYYRFAGDNGIVLPSGGDGDRPLMPEIGDTRWNTDLGYLECFDGSVYVISTGAGIEVTLEIMEDLGHVYTLMLG
jgi:hypothetical protein